MGSLRDEVYENLDYLSQLTEVVIGPQNEMLALVPDRIELSLDAINKNKSYSWNHSNAFELELTSFLTDVLPKQHHNRIGQILDNFSFELSPDVEIDLENGKMTGHIAIVKNKQQIDDKKILEHSLIEAGRHLRCHEWPAKKLKERAVTVLNTLEPGSGNTWLKTLQGRVGHQAQNIVMATLKRVITENKWRVREATVIENMGRWINSYLGEQDNGVGLVNLIKLKMMVNRDLPVYSIQEVMSVNPV